MVRVQEKWNRQSKSPDNFPKARRDQQKRRPRTRWGVREKYHQVSKCAEVLVHIRVLAPKSHGNITQFFLKTLSVMSHVTFCFYCQTFWSKREGSGHMISYKGSPVCHVLIRGTELQHIDSHLPKEEV